MASETWTGVLSLEGHGDVRLSMRSDRTLVVANKDISFSPPSSSPRRAQDSCVPVAPLPINVFLPGSVCRLIPDSFSFSVAPASPPETASAGTAPSDLSLPLVCVTPEGLLLASDAEKLWSTVNVGDVLASLAASSPLLSSPSNPSSAFCTPALAGPLVFSASSEEERTLWVARFAVACEVLVYVDGSGTHVHLGQRLDGALLQRSTWTKKWRSRYFCLTGPVLTWWESEAQARAPPSRQTAEEKDGGKAALRTSFNGWMAPGNAGVSATAPVGSVRLSDERGGQEVFYHIAIVDDDMYNTVTSAVGDDTNVPSNMRTQAKVFDPFGEESEEALPSLQALAKLLQTDFSGDGGLGDNASNVFAALRVENNARLLGSDVLESPSKNKTDALVLAACDSEDAEIWMSALRCIALQKPFPAPLQQRIDERNAARVVARRAALTAAVPSVSRVNSGRFLSPSSTPRTASTTSMSLAPSTPDGSSVGPSPRMSPIHTHPEPAHVSIFSPAGGAAQGVAPAPAVVPVVAAPPPITAREVTGSTPDSSPIPATSAVLVTPEPKTAPAPDPVPVPAPVASGSGERGSPPAVTPDPVTMVTPTPSAGDGAGVGAWTCTADGKERVNMRTRIFEYLVRRTPSASAPAQATYLEGVVVPAVEESLYRKAAGNRAVYMDPTTLKARLKQVFSERAAAAKANAGASITAASSAPVPSGGIHSHVPNTSTRRIKRTSSQQKVAPIAEADEEDEEDEARSRARSTATLPAAPQPKQNSIFGSYVLAPRWGTAPHPWTDVAKTAIPSHIIRHYPAQADGGLHVSLVSDRRPRLSPHLPTLNKWQHRQCAQCGVTQSTGMFSTKAMYCFYTELLYCPACISPTQRRIPWRILHDLDDGLYQVCTTAAEYIDMIWNTPMIALSAIAPRTLATAPNLQRIMQLRARIADLLEAITVAAADQDASKAVETTAESMPSASLTPLQAAAARSRAAADTLAELQAVACNELSPQLSFMLQSVELLPLSLIVPAASSKGSAKIVKALANAVLALQTYGVAHGFEHSVEASVAVTQHAYDDSEGEGEGDGVGQGEDSPPGVPSRVHWDTKGEETSKSDDASSAAVEVSSEPDVDAVPGTRFDPESNILVPDAVSAPHTPPQSLNTGILAAGTAPPANGGKDEPTRRSLSGTSASSVPSLLSPPVLQPTDSGQMSPLRPGARKVSSGRRY